MKGYLGEFDVNIADTEFRYYAPQDWALYWIEMYGQFDGAHHKQWVLDQVVRILKGTKVIVKLAKWETGHQEFRVSLNEPSEKYLNWVAEMKKGEDGPETYPYDEGIAP